MILTETKPEGAVVLAERLRADLAACDLRSRGAGVAVTASFGVGYSGPLVSSGDLSVRTLLEAADGALYAAKRGGRDRVIVA